MIFDKNQILMNKDQYKLYILENDLKHLMYMFHIYELVYYLK